MRKDYDIELGGTNMTDQEFETLANNTLLGGIKHCYNAKTINYGGYLYANAKEDMKAFKNYYERKGYRVLCSNRNRSMTTEGGEYTATLVSTPVLTF